jgi:hypothetical protein
MADPSPPTDAAPRPTAIAAHEPAHEPFDWRRWLRIGCRTTHLLCMAMLVGGHFFAQAADTLRPWLYGTIATGAGLWATDLGQGWQYLREVRAMTVLLKLVLVASVAWLWDWRVPMLFAVVLLSGVVSHMPGRYRYWTLGQGPPASPEEERAGLG